ncbi:hypothetical protein C0J52_19748, partial [Blattella germanica]
FITHFHQYHEPEFACQDGSIPKFRGGGFDRVVAVGQWFTNIIMLLVTFSCTEILTWGYRQKITEMHGNSNSQHPFTWRYAKKLIALIRSARLARYKQIYFINNQTIQLLKALISKTAKYQNIPVVRVESAAPTANVVLTANVVEKLQLNPDKTLEDVNVDSSQLEDEEPGVPTGDAADEDFSSCMSGDIRTSTALTISLISDFISEAISRETSMRYSATSFADIESPLVLSPEPE